MEIGTVETIILVLRRAESTLSVLHVGNGDHINFEILSLNTLRYNFDKILKKTKDKS